MAELDLPPPSGDRLLNSPLKLAVCQVRYDKSFGAADPRNALAVHTAVQGVLPVIEESPSVVGGIGPIGGVQVSTGAQGWNFKTPDGAWVGFVGIEACSLETSAYLDWSDYRSRFETLLHAVKENVSPTFETRMGLRYVDRIVVPTPEGPHTWAQWIDPAFLGPFSHGDLGPGGTALQSALELRVRDETGAIVRLNFSRDETEKQWVLILDTDCFRQGMREFALDAILEALEELHRLALQIFQAVVTDELFARMRGGETS